MTVLSSNDSGQYWSINSNCYHLVRLWPNKKQTLQNLLQEQTLPKNAIDESIQKITQLQSKQQVIVIQEPTPQHLGLANLYFSNETNGRNCETDMHYHSWDPGGLTGTCAQFSCAKGGMATYKEYCQRHNCILNFTGVTKHSCSQEFVQQVKTVCAKNRGRCQQESYMMLLHIVSSSQQEGS